VLIAVIVETAICTWRSSASSDLSVDRFDAVLDCFSTADDFNCFLAILCRRESYDFFSVFFTGSTYVVDFTVEVDLHTEFILQFLDD
jgi:hypothetical protein